MGALRIIPPKIGKLIPLLSSDNDGQALSTVRAIDRTSKGAGLDWHAVAAVFTTSSRPSPAEPRPASWGRLRPHERVMYLDRLFLIEGLSEWELSFLRTLAVRLRSAPHASFSPRQEHILNGLIGRAFQEDNR